eukprot:m.134554 g.134554  ORF g.134554 m.134554 type:complete len:312 (-) comp13874_c0_seq3:627-1562(-)
MRLALTSWFVIALFAVHSTAQDHQSSRQLRASGQSWGCPFLDTSDSPCYNTDCIESQNNGLISAECCAVISEYCETSISNNALYSSTADPACYDSTLHNLFQAVCATSSSSAVESAVSASWISMVQEYHNAVDSEAVDTQSNYWQTCPFARQYDNPCFQDSCSQDASHGVFNLTCCDAIETYCLEELDTDPACRNPDLGGLFFVFCNSSFANPDWPSYSPKGGKGKGGLLGGAVAHGVGTAALVGVSAVACFYIYRQHRIRRMHDEQQQYQRFENAAADPLLGRTAAAAPPKYEQASESRAIVGEAPPNYS